MLKAAAKRGIPTAVHESNAIPGLTTRMLESHVDLIMVGFEACRENYRHGGKVLVTGTPVRRDFFTYTKKEARKRLGLTDGRPLVVSFWGSLGAGEMNRQTAEFLALEAKNGCPFHHVHAGGVVGNRAMREQLLSAGVNLEKTPELEVREYIDDMGTLMRAADLVICRAGASTISELTTLGGPAVIVPSPNVANNHQESNARVLSEAGGAVMVLERESSGAKLFALAREILEDGGRRRRMGERMASLGTVDAAERIYEAVAALCKEKQQGNR